MKPIEFPKWIEAADSTPEERKGIVVQNAAEEKALLEKMTQPGPKPAAIPSSAIAPQPNKFKV